MESISHEDDITSFDGAVALLDWLTKHDLLLIKDTLLGQQVTLDSLSNLGNENQIKQFMKESNIPLTTQDQFEKAIKQLVLDQDEQKLSIEVTAPGPDPNPGVGPGPDTFRWILNRTDLRIGLS